MTVARTIELPAEMTSGLGQKEGERERERAGARAQQFRRGLLTFSRTDILPTVLRANDPFGARGGEGRGEPGAICMSHIAHGYA